MRRQGALAAQASSNPRTESEDHERLARLAERRSKIAEAAERRNRSQNSG